MEWNGLLAGDTPTTVIPLVSNSKRLHLISGELGPLRAGLPLEVPLWAARALQDSGLARLLPPKELSDSVQVQTQLARLDSAETSGLPEPPAEFARERARLSAIANRDQEELWGRREALLRKSVHGLLGHVANQDPDAALLPLDVTLDGLSRSEIALVKTLLKGCWARALELRVQAARVRSTLNNSQAQTNSQSQDPNA